VCKKLYKTFDEVTASDQDIEGNIHPQRLPSLIETLADGDRIASQDLKRLHTQGVCSHGEEDTVERWSYPRVLQELEHTTPFVMVLCLGHGGRVAATGIEDGRGRKDPPVAVGRRISEVYRRTCHRRHELGETFKQSRFARSTGTDQQIPGACVQRVLTLSALCRTLERLYHLVHLALEKREMAA